MRATCRLGPGSNDSQCTPALSCRPRAARARLLPPPWQRARLHPAWRVRVLPPRAPSPRPPPRVRVSCRPCAYAGPPRACLMLALPAPPRRARASPAGSPRARLLPAKRARAVSCLPSARVPARQRSSLRTRCRRSQRASSGGNRPSFSCN